MIGLRRIIEPTDTPVSLAEAKLWLRIDHEEEDDLILSLVQAATGHVEKFTQRQLLPATWRLTLDNFPPATPIYLTRSPVIELVSLSYLDLAGVRHTVDPSTYDVDTASEPGRIAPKPNYFWPFTSIPRVGNVQADFRAGYADAPAVPAGIKTAIRLMLAHWYENREAVVTGTIATEIPMGATALLWPYRAPWLL